MACPGCPSRKQSLVRNLDEATLFALSSLRKKCYFERGQALPFALHGHAGFHVVRSGKVKISLLGTRARVIRIKGPGRLVGYGSGARSNYLVHALEPVETCFFAHAGFGGLAARNPELLNNVVMCLDEVLWETGTRVFGLEGPSVKFRVASVLHYLNRDFGVPSPLGSRIDLVMERAVYAELAGTTVESFSRCLTDLELDGVVSRRGWEIHIINTEALSRWAEVRS